MFWTKEIPLINEEQLVDGIKCLAVLCSVPQCDHKIEQWMNVMLLLEEMAAVIQVGVSPSDNEDRDLCSSNEDSQQEMLFSLSFALTVSVCLDAHELTYTW